jgi:hypothetical protein
MPSKEAELRESNEILNIPSYVSFRRDTGGSRMCFDLVEYRYGIHLPEYVYGDPVFISGYTAATDLIILPNVRILSIFWSM